MITPAAVVRKFRFHYWPRLRWRAAKALMPRREVRSRGLRFSLSCDNWITEYRWRCFNEKEPETLDWIDRFFGPSGGTGRVFFDIGANVGVYSLYAAMRYQGLKVFSFEPEFANLHLLRDNVVSNRLQEQVTVFALALGCREEISFLQIQDLTPGAALHSVSKVNCDFTEVGKKVIGREGIFVSSLDRFCSEMGVIPDSLKIDVDGNEREILEGGRKTLALPRVRSLLIEVSDLEVKIQADCRQLLSEAGFGNVDCRSGSGNQIWVKK